MDNHEQTIALIFGLSSQPNTPLQWMQFIFETLPETFGSPLQGFCYVELAYDINIAF